jgi:hypothetical protein
MDGSDPGAAVTSQIGAVRLFRLTGVVLSPCRATPGPFL